MDKNKILFALTAILSFIAVCVSGQVPDSSVLQPEAGPSVEITEDTTFTRDPTEILHLEEPARGWDSVARQEQEPVTVYVFPIRENIMPATVKLTDRCLKEADRIGADYVVIDMNTYGGLLDAADSIRTRVLNYHKPVFVYINNQAASAGALIAIAADSIYMREGASIGAATVVSQDGDALPDKYQSFMRSMMRSTAEAHGKVPEVHGADTVWRWHRDPRIAEAMVDPTVSIEGLIGPDKVLTFSTEEAIEWYYCEGRASSLEQVLERAGIENYTISEYSPTFTDALLRFFTNPAFQGILIMLIIGGIYFELQTPGIGLPLIVAVTAALLYFAPLYIEGLVANWELILFILGIILIIIEIFVTPGFGVLGIAGIVAVILGLAFAMVDTELLKYIPSGQISAGVILRPIALVLIAVTASLILSIWLGKKLLTVASPIRSRVVLTSAMSAQEGYVSHDPVRNLVGMNGTTYTPLRPSGKVLIDGQIYEAAGDNGFFIDRNVEITVTRDEGGVLYCRRS